LIFFWIKAKKKESDIDELPSWEARELMAG
jgi:hypothetical protein